MQLNPEQKRITLPKGFVYLTDTVPDIISDIRYATHNNFVGVPIDGYHSNVIICTTEAAEALHNIQKELNTQDLGLKIFDAYRPISAIQHFKKWISEPENHATKAEYYPDLCKSEILNGYIAEYSAHSRGSTVDLTIVTLKDNSELNMGTTFDFFGELSHTENKDISIAAQQNRYLLLHTMTKHGFKNYWKEWWHYQLVNEPFTRTPEDHFNFPVA